MIHTGVVGHYTAMMWKANLELGCGSCFGPVTNFRNRKGYSDVCQYANKPPNFDDGRENTEVKQVPQDNTPTTSESVCCLRVYKPYGATDKGGKPITTAPKATTIAATDKGGKPITPAPKATTIAATDKGGKPLTPAPKTVSDIGTVVYVDMQAWIVVLLSISSFILH